MAMKSTKKTAVQKISPGTYRVVEVGGRSAITGRYVRAINAARHARTTLTETTSSSGSHSRSTATGRFVAERTSSTSTR